MAVIATISVNAEVASGDTVDFNVTITGAIGDADQPLPTDKFIFTQTAATLGSFKGFPLNATPFTIYTDTVRNTFTATATAQAVADKTGSLTISGSKQNDATKWVPTTPASMTIYVKDIVFESQIFTKQIMPVSAIQTPTPQNNPEITSQFRCQLTSADGKTPSPEYPVTFIIENVRTDSSSISGIFFANNDPNALMPTQINPEDSISRATLVIKTDSTGTAILNVVSNSNPGYISVTPSTNVRGNADSSSLYIYNLNDERIDEAPSTMITDDISDLGDKFPVRVVNTLVTQQEFIALVINDKFQAQKTGYDFTNGNRSQIFNADTSSLISYNDTDKIKNVAFTLRSSGGDAIPSKSLTFKTTGDQPFPTPETIILTPMVRPDGGAINKFDMSKGDYPATMNILADVSIVQNNLNITLMKDMYIVLYYRLRGDLQQTNNFQSNNYIQSVKLTDADLTNNNFIINIPKSRIDNYGTPASKNKPNDYTMWYGYKYNDSDPKTFASSPIVSGKLTTRA
jgi:hypothetical protein